MPEAVLAAQSLGRSNVGTAHERRRWRMIAIIPPLWLWVFSLVAPPGSFDALLANPPSVAGYPMGAFVIAASVLLTLAASAVIATTRSSGGVVAAVVLLIIPATLLILVGPLAILLLLTLAT